MKFEDVDCGYYHAFDPSDNEEFIFEAKYVDDDGDWVCSVTDRKKLTAVSMGRFYICHDDGFFENYVVTPCINSTFVNGVFVEKDKVTMVHPEVDELINHVQKVFHVEQLKTKIDKALEDNNKDDFIKLTNELRGLLV